MEVWEVLEEGPTPAQAAAAEEAWSEHGIRVGLPVPDEPVAWLHVMFPGHVYAPMADHHLEAWRWAEGMDVESAPDPLALILARGGGKSSTAELLAAYCGLTGRRVYVWYVRDTQDRADDSVSNIAALLESEAVERHYPRHADRKLSKYGHSKGWKSSRLRTAGGLTIDAIGLDTAARGLKVEERRPDLIILDDVDAKHDTPKATAKKIATATTSVLAAGRDNCTVFAIQNLIIPGGFFTRLTDGRADYLQTARVVGPVPALEDMETEVVARDDGRRVVMITAGTPTWAGQPVEACQRLLNLIGLRAFKMEAQHEVKKREGALWTEDEFRYILPGDVPELARVAVGVDPSGGSAEVGILAVGLGVDGRIYVLLDATVPGSRGPHGWARAAIAAYDLTEAGRIIAESNFGGDMVKGTIAAAAREEGRRVPVKLVRASRGKEIRAEPVAVLYESGLVDHVGPFPELESELTSWVPGDAESPNRLDALVWAITYLALKPKRGTVGGFYPGMAEDLEELEEEDAA